MASASQFAQTCYRFDCFEVDFRTGELRRKGRRVTLPPQPLQILLALLERPGELVSRDQLIKRLWPEGTFVDFDHSLNKALNKLRDALHDSAEKPRYIETLSRRGYRFIWPIVDSTRHTARVAVLPLENMSRDPEQDYFAEGLTESLITMLAKIQDLHVISRTTTMQYKGCRKSVREIARELQVETIVEGAVLRSGNRVRVTAQLIDAASEAHL
jgi:DNA-binding winged helix-turn-helix (wHTH) protein